mmetsp:Transcript_10690/g.25135  ORF Transcript_10690/g.25135 Transcript_10690/m.25135 type:complete len:251 (+) Transcript_10690:644-1396(+)
MSVVITLRCHVVGECLVRSKPAINVGELLADVIALVIQRACDAALHMRHVLHVNEAGPAVWQEERRLGVAPQFAVDLLQGGGKLAFAVAHEGHSRTKEVAAPRPEECSLEIQQLLCSGQQRLLSWNHWLLGVRKGPFYRDHDIKALRHQAAVYLHGREQAIGNFGQERPRLVAVRAHGHLHDTVVNVLLLKHQPHFLAIRAPPGLVTEDRDTWTLPAFAEVPNLCICVWRKAIITLGRESGQCLASLGLC